VQNPENKTSNTGWSLFSALFGWQNSATLGSILAYVFYWVLVIGILVTMKTREGRAGFGKRSVALPQ
jgi:high-affinity iron transporter